MILWFLFCHKDAQIPCTAPTADQMYDVLWKELDKWHRLMPQAIQDLFELTQDYIRVKERPKTWFARAKTANPEKPEALAGIHADHVMFIVDEASAVHNKIYEVAEGALTSDNILVILISNPTRLSGYFYDTHHSDKENWQTLQFSSIDSPLVDEAYNARIEQKYGKDSDEYRIRVLGEFPAKEGLDGSGYVFLLQDSDLRYSDSAAMTGTVWMGVDCAGEGVDESVWVLRDSFKAKVIGVEKKSTPESIAQHTMTLAEQYGVKSENIFIDNFGVGADVGKNISIATQGKWQVNTINVGDSPIDDRERFLNLRAEASWKVRDWIRTGAELVRHGRFSECLLIKFKRNLKGKIQIMGKDEMRKQGIKSPDVFDALSLTFCQASGHDSKVSDSDYNREASNFISNMGRINSNPYGEMGAALDDIFN